MELITALESKETYLLEYVYMKSITIDKTNIHND